MKAMKPSLATKLKSFVIYMDHLQPILETQVLTHEYIMPYSLLNVSYWLIFPFCRNIWELSVWNQMIIGTLSWGVNFCTIIYYLWWHKWEGQVIIFLQSSSKSKRCNSLCLCLQVRVFLMFYHCVVFFEATLKTFIEWLDFNTIW